MKRISVTTIAIAGIILFASCKSGKNVNQILSKSETRKEVMNTIANSANMSKEMKDMMLNKENAYLITKENHDGMGMRKESNIIVEKYKSDPGVSAITHFNMMVN